MNVLFVALGAAVGGPLRYAIDQYFHKFTAKPVGIFLVNTLGSFFIGFTYVNSKHLHDLFAIGLAGAFTTWSSFMLEINNDLNEKKQSTAFWHIVSTFILGILAAWLGVKLSA